MIVTGLNEFKKKAEGNTRAVVYREIIGDSITPVTMLMNFYKEEDLFLLESANLNKTFSRFSFFGVNPRRIIKIRDGKVIESVSGSEKVLNEAPLAFMSREFSKEKAVIDRDYGDFDGGFVGFFGYESVNYLEILRKEVKENSEEDAAVFFEIDRFYAIDSHRNKVYAAASVSVRDNIEEAYNKGVEITRELEAALFSHNIFEAESGEIKSISKEYEKEEFIEKVKSIKQEIIDGEAIQVVFSNKYTIDAEINPVSFYRSLRRVNPSPYMFYFKHGDKVLTGSSPETHLKVVDGKATLKPIAGTYRFTPDDDIEAVKKGLLEDPKERAEHLMLLDLGRNDLYTSCETDSVTIEKSFVPEVYSHVIHIVSEVSGKLKDNFTPVELFSKTFPAGTVSGAPKVRAIELIDQYESSYRNFYSGCVGYFGYNGDTDTCITIRSALLERDKITLRAGAGIVYDSVPESEFKEIDGKLGALFSAVEKVKELEEKDVFTRR